jgi:ubiquinone/menaquinone biosynthesis C-methylase UbiE
MFSDPEKNLKALGLRENSVIADLGAGTGFYSLAAAKVATQGKVYAVELEKDFLDTIKHKAQDARLNNIHVIWGNVEKIGGTKIGDGVADAVIASNILYIVEDKEKFVQEIKRILRPGGKVLLVDWSESSIMKADAVVTKDKAKGMFEKAGIMKEREIDAGAHHYGMILVKNK